MTALEWVSAGMMVVAAVFFLAGTAGILRFPDTLSRLHALTKSDNLGLGILVAALMLQAASPVIALKLLLAWVLALIASAVSCFLIAHATGTRSSNREAVRVELDA